MWDLTVVEQLKEKANKMFKIGAFPAQYCYSEVVYKKISLRNESTI